MAFRESMVINQKLVEESPGPSIYQGLLAEAATKYGDALMAVNRAVDARPALQRAVEMREIISRDQPEVVERKVELAHALLRLGQTERALGEVARAAEDWRRSLALVSNDLASRSSRLLIAAGCRAGLSSLAAIPGSGVSSELGRAEADRAIGLVRQAIALRDHTRDEFLNYTPLDPIRTRSDFELLMMDAAMPKNPFARVENP